MQIQLVRGIQANSSSTNPFTQKGGALGDAIVSELNPIYYQAAKEGRLFTSYVATVATSLAATATIGNMLWNPPGSGVDLVLLDWTSNIVVTSASTTGIAIAAGYQTTTPTTTTAATVAGSTYVQQTTLVTGSKAVAYSVATVLTAPVIVQVLEHNTAAIQTVGVDAVSGDFKGSIVVSPGGFVTLCALGSAVAASGHTSHLKWMEVASVA